MRVFFAAFEEADMPGIAPVMRALAERGGWEPAFIPGIDFKEHRGHFARARGPDGIPVRRLDHEPTAVVRALAQERAGTLLADAIRWGDEWASCASFDARVLGTSMRRRLFERPYARSLFEAYAEYEVAFDSIVHAERPEMVVLGEDTDYVRGRLAARVVSAHRIPVVCLAAFYYNVFVSYPLLGERRALLYLTANGSHAERLRRAGVAAERIEVVGNPAFDSLATETAPPKTPPTFLYALQGLAWEREIATDLAAIVRDRPDTILALKPHPELPPPTWLAPFSTEPRVRVLEPASDATAALRRAACLIAQSSSLLYVAAVLGRPVIVPHYDAAPPSIHLPDADRAHVLTRTRTELRRAVENVLAGRGRALGREEIAPFHPCATERVVECLERFRGRLRGGEH